MATDVPARHPATLTARALARREVTRAIVEEARRQLAEVGPAALSVRSVARELGMASSAVYRYFATRDALLTTLLVVCYDELGAVAEAADAAVEDRGAHLERWLAVTRAIHGWARDHAHDYALLYGSPVPGYAAPRDTVEPAARAVRVVLRLVADGGQRRQQEKQREDPTIDREASAAVAPVRELARALAPDAAFSDDMTYRALVAWGGLIGVLTLELFGHLHNAITDYDAWFEQSMLRLAPL